LGLARQQKVPAYLLGYNTSEGKLIIETSEPHRRVAAAIKKMQ
jgi:hypothetical protein